MAEGFYNDGLTYLFKNASGLQEVRPRHIHFAILSETIEEKESCDFRFYSVEPNKPTESSTTLRDLQDGT